MLVMLHFIFCDLACEWRLLDSVSCIIFPIIFDHSKQQCQETCMKLFLSFFISRFLFCFLCLFFLLCCPNGNFSLCALSNTCLKLVLSENMTTEFERVLLLLVCCCFIVVVYCIVCEQLRHCRAYWSVIQKLHRILWAKRHLLIISFHS